MDPLSVLALAKYIPDVIQLFDKRRGKKAKSALGTVGKIADELTQGCGKDSLRAIEEDPKLALEFQLAVMSDSHIQDQLDAEDRKAARDSYKVNPHKAEDIADHIIKYNLVLVVLLVIINVLAVTHLRDNSAVLAIVSNFIGIVLHALLNERASVTSFYFGSSLGSKIKHKNNEST